MLHAGAGLPHGVGQRSRAARTPRVLRPCRVARLPDAVRARDHALRFSRRGRASDPVGARARRDDGGVDRRLPAALFRQSPALARLSRLRAALGGGGPQLPLRAQSQLQRHQPCREHHAVWRNRVRADRRAESLGRRRQAELALSPPVRARRDGPRVAQGRSDRTTARAADRRKLRAGGRHGDRNQRVGAPRARSPGLRVQRPEPAADGRRGFRARGRHGARAAALGAPERERGRAPAERAAHEAGDRLREPRTVGMGHAARPRLGLRACARAVRRLAERGSRVPPLHRCAAPRSPGRRERPGRGAARARRQRRATGLRGTAGRNESLAAQPRPDRDRRFGSAGTPARRDVRHHRTPPGRGALSAGRRGSAVRPPDRGCRRHRGVRERQRRVDLRLRARRAGRPIARIADAGLPGQTTRDRRRRRRRRTRRRHWFAEASRGGARTAAKALSRSA